MRRGLGEIARGAVGGIRVGTGQDDRGQPAEGRPAALAARAGLGGDEAVAFITGCSGMKVWR
jgi:hypothetical protein